MINNIIVNLEKDIIKTINESNLPISVVALILSKIASEVKIGLDNTLAQEKEQEQLDNIPKEGKEVKENK